MKHWFVTGAMLVVASVALAETVTWTGSESSDWSTAANWSATSGAKVPAAGDDVVIATGKAVLSVATPRLNSLTLSGATLEFKESVWTNIENCVAQLDAEAVTVQNNAIITHIINTYDRTDYNADGATMWKVDGRVYITCKDFTLDATSKIDVRDCGWYQHASANGAPGPGGRHPSSLANCAASHGGIGSGCHFYNLANSPIRSTARPYDTPEAPVLPGSAGSYLYANGSAGGGAVRLAATGSVVIQGEIRAGVTAQSNRYGASGGSIWISCRTIAGSGYLEADGQLIDSHPEYCGGGGRIALTYDAAAQDASATPVPSLAFSVNSPGTGSGSSFKFSEGEIGTLYFTDDRFLPSDGVFDGTSSSIRNGEIRCASWTKWTPASLSVSGTRIRLGVGGKPAVSVAGAVTIGENGRLDIGGDAVFADSYALSCVAPRHRLWTDGAMPSLSAGSIAIGNKGALNVFPAETNGLSATEYAPVTVAGAFTIASGGTYSPSSVPTNCAVVKTTCATFSLASGGKVNVRGLGGSCFKQTAFGPGHGKAASQSGGAYGGFAGLTTSDEVTPTYGNPYGEVANPIYPGSAGAAVYSSQDGSCGGGLAWIEASGAVTLDGDIDARSLDYTGAIQFGYGSGGGINVKGLTIEGSGELLAGSTGGGYGHIYFYGTGGRIALRYDSAAEQTAIAAHGVPTLVCDTKPVYSESKISYFGYLKNINGIRWQTDIGTVYFSDGQFLSGNLGKESVLAGEIHLGDWTSWKPGDVTIDGAMIRLNPDGGLIDINGNLTLTNHAFVAIGGGACSCTNAYYFRRVFTAGAGPRLRVRGNLTLIDAPAAGKKDFEQTYLKLLAGRPNPAIEGVAIGGDLQVDGTLSIGSNCTVFCCSESINGDNFRIRARNVTLDQFGTIYAHALGFDGITRASAARNYVTAPGPGGPSGSSDGRGGGYGGYGATTANGSYAAGSGGCPYGEELYPTNCGSGGGLLANGGGCIWIEASRKLSLAGLVDAEGESSDSQYNGGGSGGGIYLRCRIFDPDPETLVITANGGRGGSKTISSYRSEGGGGRVAIWRAVDTDSTPVEDRTYVTATKGPNVTTSTSGRWGTDGTVRWKSSGMGMGAVIIFR